MYVLFWNQFAKVFVLRGVKSDASFDLPDGDEAWTTIDDSVAGFLDGLALVRKYAVESGWRNWDVRIEDAN